MRAYHRRLSAAPPPPGVRTSSGALSPPPRACHARCPRAAATVSQLPRLTPTQMYIARQQNHQFRPTDDGFWSPRRLFSAAPRRPTTAALMPTSRWWARRHACMRRHRGKEHRAKTGQWPKASDPRRAVLRGETRQWTSRVVTKHRREAALDGADRPRYRRRGHLGFEHK